MRRVRSPQSAFEEATPHLFHPRSSANHRAGARPSAIEECGDLTLAIPYDADNRLMTFNGSAATYSYDGDGRRVRKVVGSATTVLVYDARGQMVAEYSNQAPPTSGGTSYVTADHLGSTRLVTDSTGTVIARHDYAPFGEEITSVIGGRGGVTGYGVDEGLRQKFTGKERDPESGLDYFGARYNSSNLGRFISPDPLTRSAGLRDPQTWNRYAYVTNNPLKFNDPTGEARNPITNREGLNPRPSNQVGSINGTAHNPHKGEYGMVRSDSKPNDRPHRGVDILAPSGAAVHAPQNGTVERITGNASDTCKTCFGLTMYIKTETGETVQFSHLSATATELKGGSSIEAGQIIAASGTSGNAHDVPQDEQHLHVQVYDQAGREMNPVDYFNDPNTMPNTIPNPFDQNPYPPARTCTPDRHEHEAPPVKK
jgi:RHS repeat-associated protein